MKAEVFYGKEMYSTKNGSGPVGESTGTIFADGGLNGTITYVWNSSNWEGTNCSVNNETNGWYADQFGPAANDNEAVDDLLMLQYWNNGTGQSTGVTTDPTTFANFYFIGNSDYSFLAGVSNSSVVGTAYPYTNSTGPVLGVMFQNQTIKDGLTINDRTKHVKAAMKSGTWYYYAIGNSNGTVISVAKETAVYLGKITFASNVAGTTRLRAFNSTGDPAAGGNYYDITSAFTYAVDGEGYIQNMTTIGAAGGNFTLFHNATLSKSGNMLVGYTHPSLADDDATVKFAIALKNAPVVTTNDLKSGTFKYVSIGNGTAQGSTQPNSASECRVGKFFTDANLKVTTGNYTVIGNYTAGSQENDNYSLVNNNFAVNASAALNTVRQGNVTLQSISGQNAGNYLARKVDNVMVGMWANNTRIGLQIVMPAGVQSGELETDVANATFADMTGVDTDTGVLQSGRVLAEFESAVGNGAVPGDDVIASKSLTDLKDIYGLPAGTQMIIPPKAFHHRVSLSNGTAVGDNSGNPVYVTSHTFKGGVEGKTVANLGTMLKLCTVPNATIGATANTRKVLTFISSWANVADGTWWISRDSAGYTPMVATMPLSDQNTYRLFIAIADNGNFDGNGTRGIIRDPSGGFSIPGGGADEGSSDDDGCVFNPAASMSLEFLLLLLVPVAFLIRRRKK